MNKLSSAKTQLPYEYYSLPYCRPAKIISSAENLGEVLRGDRIVNSKYQVSDSCRLRRPLLPSVYALRACIHELHFVQMAMRTDEQCKFLCTQQLDAARAKAFRTRVEEDYRVNMCGVLVRQQDASGVAHCAACITSMSPATAITPGRYASGSTCTLKRRRAIAPSTEPHRAR